MKTYIKMNEGNILSLGNLFNCIKEISKTLLSQNDIFCALFNTNDVKTTTINNYVIGIRAIGIDYKKYYMDLKNIYRNNKNCYINVINSLMNIIDNKIYSSININNINNSSSIFNLCQMLNKISKIDSNIDNDFISHCEKMLNCNDLYTLLIKYLNYIILENKQPIYYNNSNIDFNNNELKEYLKIKLYEGNNYIYSLMNLSKKNNMYACAELGSLEYDGLISGKPNYKNSYKYYLKSANKNHPKSCYMIAYMIYNKKVDYSFNTLWNYLNKAIKYGSTSAINLLGLCYLNGIVPNNKINIDKAIECFEKSSNEGYAYSFNNLGKIYELRGNEAKAISYYKLSADLNESWALNKVGEYYRKKGDLDTAYLYYKLSSECPIKERCKYSIENLNKYYKKN